ncbi:TPA: hypothetical protein DEP94_01410 [Candidatus Nomurabacteria bacterium]|nr:hypothetical protein [Candidatus Nomurabacteria bacterium]
MANKTPDLIIGIDIGSSYIRAIGCTHEEDVRFPTVISSYKKPIEGIERGVTTDKEEVTQAIIEAVNKIEDEVGKSATYTLVSLGALSLSSHHANGHTQVSRGDAQVTDLDIENAIKDATRGVPDIRNKSVVHTIPIKYKLDGNEVLGDALGVRGNRLEVKTLFVTYPLKAMNLFKEVLDNAGIEVTDIVAGPIAESIPLLTKKQKTAGALLLNIGSGVTSILVYENNIPLLVSTIPVGGDDITKDIALGLKVTLEEAEEIKCGRTSPHHSIRKVEEIIEARLEDLCVKINKELDRIHRRELLPAGVIVCGGCTSVARLEYVLRNELKLPIKITSNELSRLTNDKLRDTSWARVYGLTFLAPNDKDIDVFKDLFTSFFAKIKRIFSQFMP